MDLKKFIYSHYKIVIAVFFIATIILNYLYGSYLYAKVLGKEQLYTIGQLCVASQVDCEATYFKDYLAQIALMASEDRSFFSGIIIQNDQVSYSGNCPCPNNTDRAGNMCGGRSSYSKHGQISYCYDSDVSDSQVEVLRDSMIADIRKHMDIGEQNAIGVYKEQYTLGIIILFYGVLLFYFKTKAQHVDM